MLEKIKTYLVAIAAGAAAILYLLLNRSNNKVKELSLEKATLNNQKDLANVNKKAEDSKTKYVTSSNAYTAYRKANPKLRK